MGESVKKGERGPSVNGMAKPMSLGCLVLSSLHLKYNQAYSKIIVNLNSMNH